MSAARQFGSGIFYALVSVVLVVGGLSLALAEGSGNAPAGPMPSATVPFSMPAVTLPSPTLALTPSATPQVLLITATPRVATATSVRVPTMTASLRPAATATRYYYSYTAPVSCGPYAGWLRNYVVKSGDTLFHIATQYNTSVTALQSANCKTTTFIYVGELLWVPNVPTITPGVTIIPTFPTATPVPTEPLTLTPNPPYPPYYTETAAPTDTSQPDPASATTTP